MITDCSPGDAASSRSNDMAYALVGPASAKLEKCSRSDLVQLLLDLEQRLADRDMDCELAANVGQAMLVDMQRLQCRVEELEQQPQQSAKLQAQPLQQSAKLQEQPPQRPQKQRLHRRSASARPVQSHMASVPDKSPNSITMFSPVGNVNTTPKTISSILSISPMNNSTPRTLTLPRSSKISSALPSTSISSMVWKSSKRRSIQEQRPFNASPVESITTPNGIPQRRYISDAGISSSDHTPRSSNNGTMKLDASLASEIEMSLVVQTRELRFRLSEEHAKRCSLEATLSTLHADFDALKKKNGQLERSNSSNADTTWNLEVEISSLQDRNASLTTHMDKIKREKQSLLSVVAQQKEALESASSRELELAKECILHRTALETARRASERTISSLKRERADALKSLEEERKASAEAVPPSWRKQPRHLTEKSDSLSSLKLNLPPCISTFTHKDTALVSLSDAISPVDPLSTSCDSATTALVEYRAIAQQPTQDEMDTANARICDLSQHADGLTKERDELRAMLSSVQEELHQLQSQHLDSYHTVNETESPQGSSSDVVNDKSLYWYVAASQQPTISDTQALVTSCVASQTQTESPLLRDISLQISMCSSSIDHATQTSHITLSEMAIIHPADVSLDISDDVLNVVDDAASLRSSGHPDDQLQLSIEADKTSLPEIDGISVVSVGSDNGISGTSFETPSHISAWDPIAASTDTQARSTVPLGVDCVTFTMIGSYFHKYNRFGSRPQLRYCWIQPNTRCIHWTEKDPSQAFHRGMGVKGDRSLYIGSMQWTDPPSTMVKNFPPTDANAIIIKSPSRTLKLVPLSWENHDKWVSAITLLILKTRPSTVPMHQQLLMSDTEVVTKPDGSSSTDTHTKTSCAAERQYSSHRSRNGCDYTSDGDDVEEEMETELVRPAWSRNRFQQRKVSENLLTVSEMLAEENVELVRSVSTRRVKGSTVSILAAPTPTSTPTLSFMPMFDLQRRRTHTVGMADLGEVGRSRSTSTSFNESRTRMSGRSSIATTTPTRTRQFSSLSLSNQHDRLSESMSSPVSPSRFRFFSARTYVADVGTDTPGTPQPAALMTGSSSPYSVADPQDSGRIPSSSRYARRHRNTTLTPKNGKTELSYDRISPFVSDVRATTPLAAKMARK
ncbi:hypothetical protein BASA62_001083 [Batrachochytrium salamandrivorans]|nr:hypothetical protein BASA62_001083 [Batrachochytrium salamandrivorans]